MPGGWSKDPGCAVKVVKRVTLDTLTNGLPPGRSLDLPAYTSGTSKYSSAHSRM